ncbi:hypothetical protein KDM41_04860 [bacterium]|nr:hypothetical protein [bacterium]
MNGEGTPTERLPGDLVWDSFRQADMALLLVDAKGRVLEASRGAGAFFATPREELVGANVADRFNDPNALRAQIAGRYGHPHSTIPLELAAAEAETVRPVEIRCSRFRPGADLPGGKSEAHLAVLQLRSMRDREHDDELRAARLAKLSLMNQVSEALYGAQLDLEQILQAVLVCMTAGQGLRFNRAFLLLVDGRKDSLQGEMAIGPSNADEAARIWNDLANQSGDLFEMITGYDKSVKQTDVAVNEIVRNMRIPLENEAHILVRTMRTGHVRGITGDMDEAGADQLREWLGCREFAIAPMSTRRGPVGVIVADNAISGTAITELDLEFLQMFANQSAGAIENSRLYTELEQRLNDLHAAHARQREDQETLLKMERLSVMGETSAIVAHELRNPLVAIGGFARSLTRSIEAGDPNRVAATIIVEEVARMERIIGDLLDFIRPPKLLRQPLPVDDVVGEAVALFRPRVDEAGIELELDLQADGAVSDMNPGEIQQVVQNFLVNAMQALDGPGWISVRTAGVEGGVRVTVADNGPGFAPDLVQKLHTPFFSTKPTGSGLGLTICAQIIKAHGGVFEARNRDEGGAEFSFILPRPKDEENGARL